MVHVGKRLKALRAEFDPNAVLSLAQATQTVKETARAKFDETVDVAVALETKQLKKGQTLRGVVQLPAGTGKTVRIAVFADGADAEKALAAGAHVVGAADLAERIQKEGVFFEQCLATPSMMVHVGKVGKILGPRNLMPNPKMGTVTLDLVGAINNMNKGQVTFRADKAGVVHAGIGKASFSPSALEENIRAFIGSVVAATGATRTLALVKSVYVSSTMGTSLKVDTTDAVGGAAR